MRSDDGIALYRSLAEIPAAIRPTVVSIGVFDGVHRGHQALMRTVIDKAKKLNATPVVVTFDRHPLAVIAPGSEPPLITTVPQRARVMGAVGIRALVILHFDDEMRHMSPEEFVRAVLVEGLGCVHVVVGANFRFGHQQAGTIETLTDLGARFGFGVTIFALQLGEEDEVVSSSLIRQHIAEGQVEQVAQELDRPYVLEGTVEHGASRGRDLGFPTANLEVHDRMVLPKLGVYAGWMSWQGQRYPAVVNVGLNPTFGDRDTPIVEAFIIDFDRDLYGEQIEIEFTHRLRDELRFPDADALVRQMHADVEQARELLRL
ncbi:MAG: bifunctional riboflavin kinase/FAD synthetase [Actinomycetota bacterium]